MRERTMHKPSNSHGIERANTGYLLEAGSAISTAWDHTVRFSKPLPSATRPSLRLMKSMTWQNGFQLITGQFSNCLFRPDALLRGVQHKLQRDKSF